MKILLATDGSDSSEEAARFLTRFHLTERDEIIILHAVSEIPYEDDYHAQIRLVIKRVAPKILDASAQILKPVKAKISTIEKDGYPDTTIIEMAVNSSADLIVMGARGVKGIKLLVLGSSTRAVAINSPKPVLVIKRPPWEKSGNMKVLFATDGSEIANEAGRFLTEIPFPEDTEITLMHIAWSPISDIPEKFLSDLGDMPRGKAFLSEAKESEKIIGEAMAYLSARFEKISVLTRGGDPSREILNAEKSLRPDVITVGCRGLRGIKGMMGSVSRRILGNSESSVLIGKACAKVT